MKTEEPIRPPAAGRPFAGSPSSPASRSGVQPQKTGAAGSSFLDDWLAKRKAGSSAQTGAPTQPHSQTTSPQPSTTQNSSSGELSLNDQSGKSGNTDQANSDTIYIDREGTLHNNDKDNPSASSTS